MLNIIIHDNQQSIKQKETSPKGNQHSTNTCITYKYTHHSLTHHSHSQQCLSERIRTIIPALILLSELEPTRIKENITLRNHQKHSGKHSENTKYRHEVGHL